MKEETKQNLLGALAVFLLVAGASIAEYLITII